ncbi:GNAT family N-acetyltransferase [Streptomyces sp. TRM43335]|uniref:GNAT family N-acetyltransferase n=1 Tax=Streptomyces taklimakanensis TaxID=2569853 RepID=A0A6G2BB07_9ACTN|nr:GNAT family N-acetyltransferase [Streptomyces taklimakanensis]MTE19448.1 GNAT family N-acetyltransferase [Streptomyces taklimakanensis]
MRIVPTPFDHPDAVKLNDLVQQEYAERYGSEGDITPLDPSMFRPPNGLFLVAYDELERPVGTGGWRAMDENEENYRDGDAELKRMFVVREARRQGLSRRVLALLEEDARQAGRLRMVLETGTMQPEAIALYESSGYVPTEKFGVYRHEPGSRCYAKPLR